MSVTRANLIGGPCKIVQSGGTIFTKDDVNWEIVDESVDVDASMHGDAIDEVTINSMIKVTGTPWGAWENLAVLLPSAYTTPVIGSRIMGDADVPLVVTGKDGQILTSLAAGITKMPDLYLGVDKTIFGSMEWTGVVGNGLDMQTASSLYTITSGAYADSTFAFTNFRQQLYTGAWSGKTGFSAVQAQEGWTLTHELKLEPVKIQSRIVDFRIIGYRLMAKCKPFGPTQAEIEAQLKVQGTGADAGHRRGAAGADLVITGASGAVVATLKNAGLKGGNFIFGNKPLRNGEFAWVSTVGFASGVAAARATFA